MYTEEEEFNYDDYLEENGESNNKKTFIDWHFIIKVILIVLLVILIIFLVFKIKNKNVKPTKKIVTNNTQEVRHQNINRCSVCEISYQTDCLIQDTS